MAYRILQIAGGADVTKVEGVLALPANLVYEWVEITLIDQQLSELRSGKR